MDFFSSTIGIIFTLFSILLSYYLYSNPKTHKQGNAPPKAGGALPLIGHLHLVGGDPSKLPHITLASMADKYGPIFTLKMGVYTTLMINNWELVKELFTKCDSVVSSRPRVVAGTHLGFNFTMFSFAPYDVYWREVRKLISVELLSTRRLELLKDVRVSETAQSIRDLYKLWDEKKDSNGKLPVEMKEWLGDFNLNVVLRMVVGKRFSGTGDAAESRRCRAVFGEFFHLMGLFLVADTLPFLRWLDVGGYEKKMEKTAREMDSIVGEWLVEHRKNRHESCGTSDKQQDFMDVMISVVKGDEFHGYDADTMIKATCVSMIAGGADSITIMVLWTLSLLLNNRNELKKAQEELDIQIGKDRRVQESDIRNLVYLQAIVKETFRLYPALPLPGREFTEDCTLAGYHISKGTRVIVNLWKLHRDPQVWPDEPMKFKPKRFMTTHRDLDVKGQHYEFIPFGAGRRYCPGINFGLQMFQLVLADFLHTFDITTPDGELVDMTESVGLTNIKATPLHTLLSPRLSPSLYV